MPEGRYCRLIPANRPLALRVITNVCLYGTGCRSEPEGISAILSYFGLKFNCMSWKRKLFVTLHWRRLLQYFFQGLVVLAPIGITAYAVLWLFRTVDNILPNILHELFPTTWSTDATGSLRRIPGLGFLVVLFIVLFVGWLSSFFFISRLVHVFDKVLQNTPGIKFIYSSVKDFLEGFAGNKKKFDKPVLVNVDAPDVWRIGFITHEDATHFELIDHAVVYVPHSYAISGITYLVPKERIRPLKNTSPADAMKFVVSGGITEVD